MRRFGLVLAALILVFMSMSPNVLAAPNQDQHCAIYDCPFYDPNNYELGQCGESGGGGLTLEGNGNAQKSFNFLVSKGFSKVQAAGMIGNWVQESGVEPRKVQGGSLANAPRSGLGYGLAQWTDKTRQDNMKAYAGNKDRPSYPSAIYTLDFQLDFAWHELQTTEKAAYSAIIKETTVDGATETIMKKYERPGKPELEKRKAYARDAYNKFAGSAPPTTPGTPAEPDPDTTVECTSGTASGSIVAIARAELAKGVIEQPIGCDSANDSRPGNCGAEVNKYTDSHLEYWCADFVSWVYKQAGNPFTGGSSGGWRIAAAHGIRDWFQARDKYFANGPNANPKPGDVYFINNDGDARMEHVGIVEKVVGNDLYTISGNTSVDNYRNGVGVGDHVYKNFRSDNSIDGFGGL